MKNLRFSRADSSNRSVPSLLESVRSGPLVLASAIQLLVIKSDCGPLNCPDAINCIKKTVKSISSQYPRLTFLASCLHILPAERAKLQLKLSIDLTAASACARGCSQYLPGSQPTSVQSVAVSAARSPYGQQAFCRGLPLDPYLNR